MRKDPDTRRVRGLGLAGWALCAATPLIARPASARPDAPAPLTAASDRWDGYSELLRLIRQELGTARVSPLATLDFDSLQPGDALVITHPEVALDEESITRFLAEGGRVLLLDDFGTSSPLLERFHIRRETSAIQNPRRYLAQNPALAVAQPVVRMNDEGHWTRHPTTEGIREVITNHAVALVHPDLTTLLEVETTSGPKTVAATGVIEGKGRLVAIGDSSLFINLMLRYPGNRTFLEHLARYLVERDEEARDGKLYLLSGAFAQKGSFGRSTPSEELLRSVRALRAEFERLKSEGLSDRMAKILAALCALAVLLSELRQGRPGAQVRLPSFAKDAPLEDKLARTTGKSRFSAAERRGKLIEAELKEALELTLADRVAGIPPLKNSDVAKALASLPEEAQRSGQRLTEELHIGLDQPSGLRARRLDNAELSRLSSEVTQLLHDLGRPEHTDRSDSHLIP